MNTPRTASGTDAAAATNPRAAAPAPSFDLTLEVKVDGRQSTCNVTERVTLLGSRRNCGLTINHPDISRVHTAIVRVGNAVVVRDLCSRHGTKVNGEPVTLAVLKPDDTLALGPVQISLKFDQYAPSEADLQRAQCLDPAARLRFADTVLDVNENVALIGRRQQCTIPIDNPDISLAHAILIHAEGQLWLYDVGSRSGCKVDDESVEQTALKADSKIVIGDQALEIEWEAFNTSALSAAPTLDIQANPLETPTIDGPTGSFEVAALLPALLEGVELGDLESTLSGLQSRIAGTRQVLKKRSDELDAREMRLGAAQDALSDEQAALAKARDAVAAERDALKAREAELEQRASLLRPREGALDERQAKLEAAESDIKSQAESNAAESSANEEREALLTERETALTERERLLVAQEEQLNARRERHAAESAELDQRAAMHESKVQGDLQHVAQREAALQAAKKDHGAILRALADQQAAVESRETELGAGEAALRARRDALSEREAELEQRELQLAHQAQALADREEQVAAQEARIKALTQVESHASDKFNAFKAALDEAARSFEQIEGGHEADPFASPQRKQDDALESQGEASVSAELEVPSTPAPADATPTAPELEPNLEPDLEPAMADAMPAPLIGQPIFTQPHPQFQAESQRRGKSVKLDEPPKGDV